MHNRYYEYCKPSIIERCCCPGSLLVGVLIVCVAILVSGLAEVHVTSFKGVHYFEPRSRCPVLAVALVHAVSLLWRLPYTPLWTQLISLVGGNFLARPAQRSCYHVIVKRQRKSCARTSALQGG
jgi:hypothetical protein